MSISVNGVVLTQEQIAAELPRHQETADPQDAAIRECILRELIRQKAVALNLTAAKENETIGAVLQGQVKIAPPDEAACLQFYETNADAFIRDESVEVRHILFQATEVLSLESARELAQTVLAEALAFPDSFAALAKQHSHCPSSENGGDLGLTNRGKMVPEFEQALFSLAADTICPYVVETRFGLHIIQSGRKTPSSQVTFEEAQPRLTEYLHTLAQQQALKTYLHILVNEATIEGFDMG